MVPTDREIQLAVLRALVKLGGSPKAADVYPIVTEQFPDLTEAERAETVKSGGLRWINTIRWMRQRLVEDGCISKETYGVWAITDKGRTVAQAEAGAGGSTSGGAQAPPPMFLPHTLVDLVQEHERTLRAAVLDYLMGLSPEGFEAFAKRLLDAYGFTSVTVTGGVGDGGIDGHGKLKVGLALMDVAFQCKRWKGNVGGPEINSFRGAISGSYQGGHADHGGLHAAGQREVHSVWCGAHRAS